MRGHTDPGAARQERVLAGAELSRRIRQRIGHHHRGLAIGANEMDVTERVEDLEPLAEIADPRREILRARAVCEQRIGRKPIDVVQQRRRFQPQSELAAVAPRALR
jgi:hypothetical protein